MRKVCPWGRSEDKVRVQNSRPGGVRGLAQGLLCRVDACCLLHPDCWDKKFPPKMKNTALCWNNRGLSGTGETWNMIQEVTDLWIWRLVRHQNTTQPFIILWDNTPIVMITRSCGNMFTLRPGMWARLYVIGHCSVSPDDVEQRSLCPALVPLAWSGWSRSVHTVCCRSLTPHHQMKLHHSLQSLRSFVS